MLEKDEIEGTDVMEFLMQGNDLVVKGGEMKRWMFVKKLLLDYFFRIFMDGCAV